MYDSDLYQDVLPLAKEPYADYKQFEDVQNLVEIATLAADYRIWCVVGMLPR